MILVTGGAGYIGSHTCVELISEGYDPVIVDNLCNSKADVLARLERITQKHIPFVHADVRDRCAMERIFDQYRIDSVIHFAGVKAVAESIQKPLDYYSNNINGVLAVCRIMAERGVKKLVFSSSATVYGGDNVSPLNEHAELGCTNPYGWTKLMIEQILQDISVADSTWSILLLRYFNPIGAHESGLIGEDPSGIPNNLMPYITKVAAQKFKVLNVFGNDYPTPDGTGIRDFIHVKDLAKGHVAALRYANSQTGVEAINLGTGKGISVLELVSAFEKVTGQKIPYQVLGRRSGDIGVCYADPTKAEKLLNWHAELDINRMCADAWRYEKLALS